MQIRPTQIRPEQPGDEDAIHDLTVAAFAPMPYSQGTEAPIIRALRRDGDLTLSLVALHGPDIIGHIAFSPVTIDGRAEGWFGLGPVSVHPGFQRRGVGSLLVRQGLGALKAQGAKGCALIGDPDFYARFGFANDGRLDYGEVPAAYVQWLAFGAPCPRGRLGFSPAFDTQP
ncbi:N-acetyltransferase [uncultured Paracoccus sp.]|uniref:GNAT family N-acetyltransferase n=1 Tax=uncultured Paracoccus sp. TaxID=189685 RepID=UPI0026013CA0|nr:N-acetyltransferase [uncultured Paracoccus sp.]